MSATTRRWLVVCGSLGVCLILMNSGTPAAPKLVSISIRDLVTRVAIIGELGVPVGELVRIRGMWQYSEEYEKIRASRQMTKAGPDVRFHVLEVNGKPTENPVDFRDWLVINISWLEDIEKKVGETWELTGLEQPRIMGYAAQTEDELHRIRAENQARPRTLVDVGFRGAFESEFHYVRARRIK